MNKEINNIADLKNRAYVGNQYLDGPIRAVAVSHHGLGVSELRKGPSLEEYLWQKAGVLVLFPYYGPWSWMNRQARTLVDEIISATFRLYQLSPEIPIISTGSSMGGCSALLLARYSKHRIAGCLAVYPVCDTVYSFTERPDVPRTMLHAFGEYEGSLEDALLEQSPLAQADKMPDIPYCIIHGDADREVNKAVHSDKLVSRMRAAGRKVDYLEVPGYAHEGWPNRREVLEKATGFVLDFVNASGK